MYNHIVLGCDHAGFALKEELKKHLANQEVRVMDVCPDFASEIDYVQSSKNVCVNVLGKSPLEHALGVLICGTGIGVSIAANRIKGIRAGILYDEFTAEYGKRHIDLNVIVFGARTMKPDDVKKRLDLFINSTFEGGKYKDRNDKLEFIDSELKNDSFSTR